MEDRSKRLETLRNKLWQAVPQNPFALIALHRIDVHEESRKKEYRKLHHDWMYEDELPEGYDYDGNFHRSEIRDGVRMFPKDKKGKK